MKNKLPFMAYGVLFLFVLATFIFGICEAFSKQFIAKNFGGVVEYNLEENKKLVEVTWKDNDLWILTKDMQEDDIAENYSFKETSSTGLLEGEVIIHEIKN